MRPRPSLHSNFFSSLKQVEKRLKSEEQQSEFKTQLPVEEIYDSLTGSMCSTVHIICNNHRNNKEEKLSTFPGSSEPPQAFLSCSPQFTQTNENQIQQDIPSHHRKPISEANSVDEIEELVQLLGLSEGGEEESCCLGIGCGSSCYCEGGFYSKIVGVKGPKCDKESERLEGWIRHFMNGDHNGEKIEPLRLLLLLLGKAAFRFQGEDCGFGGLAFPSAVEDFLMNEPPTDKTTSVDIS